MSEGRVFVFEGPDGTGKSTLARALSRELGLPCLAFPGREPGSIGSRVHEIVSDRTAEVAVREAIPIFQLAAHIHAIAARVIPVVRSGSSLVLDRFWWSAWAYGSDLSVDDGQAMAVLRMQEPYWRSIRPVVFCLTVESPFRSEEPARWETVRRRYEVLMHMADGMDVVEIVNDGTPAAAFEQVLGIARERLIKSPALETPQREEEGR